MRIPQPDFHVLLLAAGLVMAGGIAFHLVWRGPEIYPKEPIWEVHGGNAARGKELAIRYGCGSCHVIPGLPRAVGRVGPRLEDLKRQVYIGGVLPNTPENLTAWIYDPKRFSPETAMPALPRNEAEARDIAAWILESR